MTKKALFFDKLDDNRVSCKLCPQACIIQNGKRGVCGVRRNIDGELYSEVYEKVSSISFDPIEKKPIYHYMPGSTILSIGSLGCNLHCKFCQNWEISQATVENFTHLKHHSVNEIIEIAVNKPGNIGIAFTYNEPTVWYEYMFEIARKAKEKNLKTVMVSNGFINEEPLEQLLPYMDAFSIDLKAFTEDFYKKISGGTLLPVKRALKSIRAAGKHLEIVNLVIPGLNDDEKKFGEMVSWIANELGDNSILHISRYFPNYKLAVEKTPLTKLIHLYEIARKKLFYVYLGNVAVPVEGNHTACRSCGNIVIKREGYNVQKSGIDGDGKCIYCKSKVVTTR